MAASLGPPDAWRIGAALDMEKSTVSRGADRLCAAGMLERRQDVEGRGISYVLTPAGRGRLEEVLPDWRRVQARVKRRLGEASVEALRDMVGSLSDRSR